MMAPLPEPAPDSSEPRGLFLDYLDYYRSVVTAKVHGMTDEQLSGSTVPSGWTPLELLTHLVYMEQRWLRWGFAAEPVEAPWGDSQGSSDGPWRVEPEATLESLLTRLHDGGMRTREIVEGAELTDVAAVGGRFAAGTTPPSLLWILFHVLQEYARHAGHIDVVRELADGMVGE
jgi:hypothetical protein